MKAKNNLKSLSEIHFYNDLQKDTCLKIGNKLYFVYCVANNKVDTFSSEWIFILRDIHGKKIYFDSERKAELFPIN